MFTTKQPSKLGNARLAIIISALLCCVPSACLADMGVPMLAIIYPPLWLLLAPIIIVETLLAKWIMRTNLQKSFGLAIAANLISTIVGIPVTWIIMFFVGWFGLGGILALFNTDIHTRTGQIATAIAQCAWLAPYEEYFYIMVPTACVALCVFFFLSSVWVEYLAVTKIFKIDKPIAKRWSWIANLISYVGITAYVLISAINMVNK